VTTFAPNKVLFLTFAFETNTRNIFVQLYNNRCGGVSPTANSSTGQLTDSVNSSTELRGANLPTSTHQQCQLTDRAMFGCQLIDT